MTDFDLEAATWDAKTYRMERAQAIARGIREAVPVGAGMTAFEYGCGTGLLGFALQPYLGHITLADNSSGMLAVLDEKIAAGGIGNMTSLRLDLSTDPLPELRVQLVVTLMTLHHIPDVERVLKGFYELLETPGYLCVADLDQEDGAFHGPDFDGHKGFDRAALGSLARDVGFRKAAFSTVFQMDRVVGKETRTFPVFLMVAEK